jgi:hypothetical protein
MANNMANGGNMANTCAACGANIALVGRVHRCRPQMVDGSLSMTAVERAAIAEATIASGTVVQSLRADAEAEYRSAADSASTYRYRDPEKRRAYMRNHMREQREKTG